MDRKYDDDRSLEAKIEYLNATVQYLNARLNRVEDRQSYIEYGLHNENQQLRDQQSNWQCQPDYETENYAPQIDSWERSKRQN